MPTGGTSDQSVSPEESLRREELAIRRAAVDLERAKLQSATREKRGSGVAAVLPTILAALLGLAGTAYVAYRQGATSLELEQRKFETSLILKAVETGNQQEARQNLLFFLEMGLITDRGGQMQKKLKENATAAPVLPPSSSRTATEAAVRPVEIRSSSDAGVHLSVTVDATRLELEHGAAETSLSIGEHHVQWFAIGLPGARYHLEVGYRTAKAPLFTHDGVIPRNGHDAGTANLRID